MNVNQYNDVVFTSFIFIAAVEEIFIDNFLFVYQTYYVNSVLATIASNYNISFAINW